MTHQTPFGQAESVTNCRTPVASNGSVTNGRTPVAPTASAPDSPTPPAPAQPVPGLRHFFTVVGIIVVVLGVIVAGLLVAVRVLGWQPGPGVVGAAILAVLTLFAAGIVWLVVKRSGLTARSLGFRRPSWRLLHLLWQIPATMAAAVVVSMMVNTVFLSGGGTSDVQSSAEDLQSMGGGVLALVVLLLLVAVVTPLWEEVVFRGILFQALARRMPWFLAAVIGAAVFAAVHVAPAVLPYVFVLGLAACLLFRFHRNLWAPIILHIVNNSVVTLLAAGALLGSGT